MNFGEGERRRTIRASSENLTKSTEIAAFWRVRTQSPVANRVIANLINRRKITETRARHNARPGDN